MNKTLPSVPVCNIIGVNIAAINISRAVLYVNDYLEKLSGEYICISNVHTTVMSYDNPNYRVIQNKAVLALPDGNPLSVICRSRGFKETERIAGPDFMHKLFILSIKRGYSHFFYGSSPETLEKLRSRLSERYPGLKIAGMFSPPFCEMSPEEDKIITDNINSFRADIIWVGLGAPKQEIWMSHHRGKLHGLMIGVGAGFDYFAGNIKRAPAWMQACSLEWLYRLCQEPKRLFKRYLYTNTKFLWLLVKDKFGHGD
ncbi:WecB/TagA/CpsF family glycosyltransferase [Lachnotalea sp. AF33-28]|jgi:N-acetylglucosaminyldiphosphoundecaprenol N-acetyl-beta-D-mannosaminyltransferase|uniref:WecB/TagA/CpsF family glycosyltransferase n=1 Tax=Lachnotalea sp. AF33-28 TaxID=2292046 RepID=UPI000E491442|nr:WecB/TagA/CpsF family glycosyltransferase [Lachnotalea sp. AF33-28]RHP34971.1 glycosyltransferase [Lachnotalea sp. AF33-28]